MLLVGGQAVLVQRYIQVGVILIQIVLKQLHILPQPAATI